MSNFRAAYTAYRHLRDLDFPEKATLKLVGDRYRLTRAQRNCLFRGVVDSATAAARAARIVAPGQVAGRALAVDWYNVLITVESYLKGLTVLLADDGVLRDSTAAHGSYRTGPVTGRAFEAIVEGLRAIAPSRVDVFLDAPIAHSARMAGEVRGRLAALAIPVEAALERSADFALKSYPGVVASSDSVILDRARAVLDLPRWVLAGSFGFSPLPLADLDP
jgi:hypothetical protein